MLFLDEQQIYVMQYSKVLKNQIITKLKIIYWKVYRDRLKDLGRRGETYDNEKSYCEFTECKRVGKERSIQYSYD